MATAEVAIKERLESDPTFVGLVLGGIWNREIKREGRGATPGAFDADLFLRPTVVVEGGGEVPSRLFPGAYLDQVTLHFYCPSDSTRKALITAAHERAIKLLKKAQPDNPSDLTPWWYINDDGRRMFPEAQHSATGFYPSELFLGCSEKMVTYRFHGTRSVY